MENLESRILKCPKCDTMTQHMLYNQEYKIYKCTKCNNLHV